jgi:hypothetical protein
MTTIEPGIKYPVLATAIRPVAEGDTFEGRELKVTDGTVWWFNVCGHEIPYCMWDAIHTDEMDEDFDMAKNLIRRHLEVRERAMKFPG